MKKILIFFPLALVVYPLESSAKREDQARAISFLGQIIELARNRLGLSFAEADVKRYWVLDNGVILKFNDDTLLFIPLNG